jgi:hypothetical protein
METIPGLDRHITSRRDDPFGGCVVSFEDMDDEAMEAMEARVSEREEEGA